MSRARPASGFRRSSPAALAAALVCALFAAQTAALWHELDPTPHAPDQPCEIHLAASVLGGANVGVFELPLPPAPALADTPRYAPPVFRLACAHRQARAPPFAS